MWDDLALLVAKIATRRFLYLQMLVLYYVSSNLMACHIGGLNLYKVTRFWYRILYI